MTLYQVEFRLTASTCAATRSKTKHVVAKDFTSAVEAAKANFWYQKGYSIVRIEEKMGVIVYDN